MFGIFKGLDKLLSAEVENIDIYNKNEDKNNKSVAKKALEPKDVLYLKDYECPVCKNMFKNSTVKLRTTKYIRSDTDLKMYHEPLDPMYYDVIFCTNCGYAAISKQFAKLTAKQEELIKDRIMKNFKPTEYPLVLSLDQAIERYKMALFNTIVKKGKDGEKAYLCLKLAWLYRDKGDEKLERECIENSIHGFTEAFPKEDFPICGLEIHTLTYILADLSRRTGDDKKCLQYLGSIIVDRSANTRIKDKARMLKDMIKTDSTEKK